MKRILVNATQQEELRVAVVDGQKLYNLDIEATGKRQKKGNIYKGVISSIAPSLNAVFVDYGGVRQGFLPTKEICPRYFSTESEEPIRSRMIGNLVKEGQELIVQIVREELANKGASLSTYITLTGQYLVLMPDKPNIHGISQRISGTDRQQMINIGRQITTNENEGIILRTACLNAEKRDLQKNLNYLRYLWKKILKAFNERPAPFLIYKEADIVLQTIQNNLGSDISEIIIDNQEVYERTKEFLSMVLPHYKRKLKLYESNPPLFNRMQIEAQIESLYQHKIDLPSGGAIVLDHTEALTSIDINSARATQQYDLEKTALQTNLEAIDEIARQLRLRDLGGLLVIDFIDMLSRSNKRKVEEHLKELIKKDRARTRLGNISKFGLLEMSRQRLRPSLKDESEILCPRCNGRGFIRTVKSSALVVLRLIEEEASKPKTNQVIGHVPAAVDEFLINEKRSKLDEIEQCYRVKVSILCDQKMETPHYKIVRYRENGDGKNKALSEAVSVRSSLHERQIISKQNEEEEVLAEETAAIPTVIAMEKETLSETFKNLWLKFLGMFARKKTADKQRYKTYSKQKNYSSRRSGASYKNQTSHKKTRSAPNKRNYSHKKSAYTQTDTRPSGTTKQPFKRKTEFSPLKSSLHSNRKRRQYQRSKSQHNYTDDTSTSQISSIDPRYDDKNEQTSVQPQTTEKDSTPNNAFKQPLFSSKGSKLIQVETKIKNDNDPK